MLIRRGGSRPSRRAVPTVKKKNKPPPSQQTSMSGCNAERDTSRVNAVREKQSSGKLSRYHRPRRNTRLLAVSKEGLKLWSGENAPSRASVFEVSLSTNVRGRAAGRACPGRDGGWAGTPECWRMAEGVPVFLHIFSSLLKEWSEGQRNE